MQLWDRDVSKANDMIGEYEMLLNSHEYPMLSK